MKPHHPDLNTNDDGTNFKSKPPPEDPDAIEVVVEVLSAEDALNISSNTTDGFVPEADKPENSPSVAENPNQLN